ncbi:dihydrodipicolinate synthetase family protein [Aspergillus germanicus]
MEGHSIDSALISILCGEICRPRSGTLAALTFAELKQLTELCEKFAAGRIPVVAGTGGLTSFEALELSVHAAQAGAAAVMVVPPFYDPVNLTELTALMAEIHDAAKIPVVYYNIPSATGVKLSPKELASLSKDTLTFYGLAAGARGGIWGAANIILELAVELWDTVAVKGDLKKGRELWARIWPICKFLESHNYAAAVKTGLEFTGTATGGLRKPFHMLGPQVAEEMKVLIQNAGLKTV